MTENTEKTNVNNDAEIVQANDTGMTDNEGNQSQKKTLAIIAFVIVFILLIFQAVKIFMPSDTAVEKDNKNKVNVVGKNNFFSGEEPKEEEKPIEKFDFGTKEELPPAAEPAFLLGTVTPPVEPVREPVNRSLGGFMVKKTNDSSANKFIQPKDGTAANKDDLIGGGKQADIFTAPAFKPAVAQKSNYNPHLLLSQGTMIPCSLRGRLVSNVGGQVSCIVTDNVFSSSGAVVLIEKGTTINGYYQGNTVQRGHNEIFVVWQEARTPNNITIPLYSGSTDPLGANGLSGWVDNHFWERFGNAMVLSVFNDVTGALSQNLTKDNKRDYTENTREDSRNLTAEVIKRTADIEPTLYKNQGDKINVFIARDIDFSNVYSLRPNRVSYK